MQNIQRPADDEYGKYYQNYIEKAGDNIFEILEDQKNQLHTLIRSLDNEQALYSYAEGKWSVKEIIGHLIDSERVFAYRALSFARGEQQHLPGFEQDEYVQEAWFDERSLQSLADEYLTVRNSTIELFKSLAEDTLLKKGTASGNPFSVRALLFIIAGHERHHLDILQERYLPDLSID